MKLLALTLVVLLLALSICGCIDNETIPVSEVAEMFKELDEGVEKTSVDVPYLKELKGRNISQSAPSDVIRLMAGDVKTEDFSPEKTSGALAHVMGDTYTLLALEVEDLTSATTFFQTIQSQFSGLGYSPVERMDMEDICVHYEKGEEDIFLLLKGNYVIIVKEESVGAGGEVAEESGVSELKKTEEKTPLWSYETNDCPCVAITSDGSYIAAGSSTSTYIFDKSGILLQNYCCDIVDSVSISQDCGYIAISGDRKVCFFDRQGTKLWNYEIGDWPIVAITPDGNYIAAGSCDNNVYLFDKSGNLLWSYKTDEDVRSVAITPDGSYIAAGSTDIHLFDKSGNLLWRSYGGYYMVDTIAITQDGSYIAAGSQTKNVYLYNKSGNKLWSYKTGGWIRQVAITPDGSYIAAGSASNGKICLFDKSGNLLWFYVTDDIDSVAISEDGSYIAAGSWDNNVYLFNKNGDLLWSYKTGYYVGSVAISEDGSYIVAGSGDRNVYLFAR